MRSWLLIAGWTGLALLGVGRTSQAQPADSLRAVSQAAGSFRVTVPVPAQGVVYLRMGTPGGVHIRSRHGTPPPGSAPRSEPEGLLMAQEATGQTATREPGLAQDDVERLERRLDAVEERLLNRVDAIFLRLARELEDPALASRTSVYVRQRQDATAAQPATPGQPAESTRISPTEPDADTPADLETPVVTPPVVTPPVIRQPDALPTAPAQQAPIVREVERAILETGLFRTLDVLFETDEAVLLPRSELTLNAIGTVLQKYPDLRIEVGGHADSRGPEDYNLRLSEARAASVRAYLLEQFPGIEPGRIEARGYGELRPIASNATETGLALNRRVEFVVLEGGDASSQQP